MSRAAIVLTSIALAGCAPGCSASPGLENTTWNLVAFDGEKVADGVGVPWFLLNSEEKRVIGSGGCNRMAGPYTLAPTTLTLGPLVSTKMACVNAGKVEDRFFAALAATRNWRVEGARLTLLDGTGAKLAELAAAPPRK